MLHRLSCPLIVCLVVGIFSTGTPIDAANSVGTLHDESIFVVPADATRIYWLAEDGATPTESTRTNALGDDQLLFYDVYPPIGARQRATVLYLHGGGYTVGAANNASIVEAIRQLRELGFWAVSMEYRRGWFADGSHGIGGDDDISEEEAELAEKAFDLARIDVGDGWNHLDQVGATRFPFPQRYIVIGQSAGGSLASRITLTDPDPTKEVLGAVVGFGTHSSAEFVTAAASFPVVIQGGMFDSTSPLYDNPVEFDNDMPEAKGLMNLYQELDGLGFQARLLLAAQEGHGFDAYELDDGTIEHYPEAMEFFEAVYEGQSFLNYVEYKFKCEVPDFAGFDYSWIEPGDRIDTETHPGFRFDPVLTDMENGMSPAEVMEEYDLSPCPSP